jgi:hypothetical protein
MHDEGRCFAALFAKNNPQKPFFQFANDSAFHLLVMMLASGQA